MNIDDGWQVGHVLLVVSRHVVLGCARHHFTSFRDTVGLEHVPVARFVGVVGCCVDSHCYQHTLRVR